MSHRRALCKVDRNQLGIVRALERRGATVCDIHEVAGGCPDLLVGFMGVNILMEIKSDPKARLTKDEAEWHRGWKGIVYIVYDEEQAIKVLEDLID